MVIPDWLFKLFAAIGLVDSEEKKLRKMIASYKDELRRLRTVLEDQLSELSDIEREIRRLQPKYEEAQGPAKGAYAEMIKPLLQKRNSMSDEQRVVSNNIRTLTTMLAKAEILVKAPADPERTRQIEMLTGQMDGLGDMIEDQNAAGKELERAGVSSKTEEPAELVVENPASTADAELEKELAEFNGTAAAPQKSNEEKLEA